MWTTRLPTCLRVAEQSPSDGDCSASQIPTAILQLPIQATANKSTELISPEGGKYGEARVEGVNVQQN